MGVGATFQRHEDNYFIYAGDMDYPVILKQKLEQLKSYYKDKYDIEIDQAEIDTFVNNCKEIVQLGHVKIDTPNPVLYDSIIFEGSQGVMLDAEHGFFPNVTRSDTTLTNAIEICNDWRIDANVLIGVTRCYQTRHGNGPMTGKELSGLRLPKTERNVTDIYQGEFRVATLDEDTLLYAMQHARMLGSSSNIIFTLMDRDWET